MQGAGDGPRKPSGSQPTRPRCVVTGDAASIKSVQAHGNGFRDGATDSIGLGINVTGYTTPPMGSNTAHGNDSPAERDPPSLC